MQCNYRNPSFQDRYSDNGEDRKVIQDIITTIQYIRTFSSCQGQEDISGHYHNTLRKTDTQALARVGRHFYTSQRIQDRHTGNLRGGKAFHDVITTQQTFKKGTQVMARVGRQFKLIIRSIITIIQAVKTLNYSDNGEGRKVIRDIIMPLGAVQILQTHSCTLAINLLFSGQ